MNLIKDICTHSRYGLVNRTEESIECTLFPVSKKQSEPVYAYKFHHENGFLYLSLSPEGHETLKGLVNNPEVDDSEADTSKSRRDVSDQPSNVTKIDDVRTVKQVSSGSDERYLTDQEKELVRLFSVTNEEEHKSAAELMNLLEGRDDRLSVELSKVLKTEAKKYKAWG